MPNDLDIIAQIKKRIGRIPQLTTSVIYQTDNGRQANNEQLVTGLVLNNLNLTQLPKEIGQLQNLQELYLQYNQLTQLPKEIGQLQNLQKLHLDGNQLTEFPKEIGQLQNLTSLNLDNNQLVQLPKEIGQLKKLTRLDLYNNRLTQLPKEIAQLKSLQTLGLGGNQLTQLPKELFQLNLEITWIDHYGGQNSSQKGINVKGNPFQTPPVEIIKQGRQAIIDYYKALEAEQAKPRPLNELKLLLVGDGGAGKTSLLKRLLGQTFDPNETQTHGINLNTLTMDIPANPQFSGGPVKLHCWDFGGQEIMHAILSLQTQSLRAGNRQSPRSKNRLLAQTHSEFWRKLARDYRHQQNGRKSQF